MCIYIYISDLFPLKPPLIGFNKDFPASHVGLYIYMYIIHHCVKIIPTLWIYEMIRESNKWSLSH